MAQPRQLPIRNRSQNIGLPIKLIGFSERVNSCSWLTWFRPAFSPKKTSYFMPNSIIATDEIRREVKYVKAYLFFVGRRWFIVVPDSVCRCRRLGTCWSILSQFSDQCILETRARKLGTVPNLLSAGFIPEIPTDLFRQDWADYGECRRSAAPLVYPHNRLVIGLLG